MTGKDLERLMAALLRDRTEAELARIGTELRKLSLLPSGGRGPNAPLLSPGQVGIWLVAEAAAPLYSGAGRAAIRLLPMVPVGGLSRSFASSETFAMALSAVFESVESAHLVRKIRVCEDVPAGQILWKNGEEVSSALYLEPELAGKTTKPESLGASTRLRWAEIGPGIIQQVSFGLHDSEGPGPGLPGGSPAR